MRHRTGLFLILGGLVLAGFTALLVIRIANQATEAGRSAIKQVAVVVANRDILDQTLITADALSVKAFPADFAPVGAIGNLDQVVGKFANGFIPRDQVVVGGQLLPAQRKDNLSDRVPTGKVAIWLPMPDLLAQAAILKPGDRVDILLTVPIPAAQASSGGGTTNSSSTQLTLQNVEVFRVGADEVNLAAASAAAAGGTPSGQYAGIQPAPLPNQAQGGQNGQGGQAKPQASAKAIGFLVDHQDAVIMKFIKDVDGGKIDIVLRSVEQQQIVRTDAVTLDVLVDRFRFRVPQQVVR